MTSRIDTVIQMHTYARPDSSLAEQQFIKDWIWPLGVEEDDCGNLTKRIGREPIAWCAHTDTVHKKGGRQDLSYTSGTLRLNKESSSNCLGADDTAGIYLMREMIKANKPGLYIFHRAEEIGGIGSEHIATKTPNLLCGIKAAIAFDRRGKRDVITHQAGGRCSSDAFAWSLAHELDMKYAPCENGIFTDTANYTDLVGECTNISVGYDGEHTSRECLDVPHLLALRKALLRLDVSKLVFERKPGERESYDDYEYGGRLGPWDHVFEDNQHQDMFSIVKKYPHLVADWIEDCGVDAKELLQYISHKRGIDF